MSPSSPIASIKGVGNSKANLFLRLGLNTVDDLINYYPRRYEDYSLVQSVAKIRPGQVTLEVTITSIAGRYVRKGMHITEAIAKDKTGSVRLIWFNQPYRAAAMKSGVSYYVSGNYELRRQRFSITNPSIELKTSFPINTARIIPKYRETKGLTSNDIRRLIKEVLPLIEEYNDTLPNNILKKYDLMSLSESLINIHFPESVESLKTAKYRIGFEEVFCLILASELNKLNYAKDHALRIKFDQSLAKKFVAKLPFDLTPDQRRTIWQLYLDMDKSHPMNRLIEGDVGSGKTVVAAMGGLMVINQNAQVAFMAPTELLAKQHADSIHNLLRPLSMEDQVCLLIGGLTFKQKKVAAESIASGYEQSGSSNY
jgi:ATP-dependent DNA helicase RecG